MHQILIKAKEGIVYKFSAKEIKFNNPHRKTFFSLCFLTKGLISQASCRPQRINLFRSDHFGSCFNLCSSFNTHFLSFYRQSLFLFLFFFFLHLDHSLSVVLLVLLYLFVQNKFFSPTSVDSRLLPNSIISALPRPVWYPPLLTPSSRRHTLLQHSENRAVPDSCKALKNKTKCHVYRHKVLIKNLINNILALKKQTFLFLTTERSSEHLEQMF